MGPSETHEYIHAYAMEGCPFFSLTSVEGHPSVCKVGIERRDWEPWAKIVKGENGNCQGEKNWPLREWGLDSQ